jgi:hypothetical protein
MVIGCVGVDKFGVGQLILIGSPLVFIGSMD